MVETDLVYAKKDSRLFVKTEKNRQIKTDINQSNPILFFSEGLVSRVF